MNTLPSTHPSFKRTWLNLLAALALIAMAGPLPTAVRAEAPSPFLGAWKATDPMDGSDIRLAIGGRPTGPFQITWTENYISFCRGEAGIVRGIGYLNAEDAGLLESEIHVECFASGSSTDMQWAWRYHPQTDTLSSIDWAGRVTIWTRPGQAQPESTPLQLRVNYGADWVESFYAGGHTVWITVTENDGVTVKATAQVSTGPIEWWNGETGFQTNDASWAPSPPDIEPNDWVFGWVDNGASAQVQIGEISTFFDLSTDTVTGTVFASWYSDAVEVGCYPWPTPSAQPEPKTAWIIPNGDQQYTCSWTGEWAIRLRDGLDITYTDPSGQLVMNGFDVPNARIVASEVGNWLWTTGFAPQSEVTISIFDSQETGAAQLWTGLATTDEGGFVSVETTQYGVDLEPGDYITVADNWIKKGLVLEPIAVDVFDIEFDFMAGTAPAGNEVWVAAGPQDWQQGMLVTADPATGAWIADFTTIPFDIEEAMQPWSYAQLYDADNDVNEADPPSLALWAATFTLDAGLWSPSLHSYYFEDTYLYPAPGGQPTEPVVFQAVDALPLYDGYVMLRPGGLRALVEGSCQAIPEGPAGIPPNISTSQPTRFVYGWVTDYPMTYEEALAHFGSMTVKAYWDGDQSIDLVRQEIVPYSPDEWQQYVCSFAQ